MVQCVTDCGECGTGWSSIGSSVQERLTNVFSLENRVNSFYGKVRLAGADLQHTGARRDQGGRGARRPHQGALWAEA